MSNDVIKIKNTIYKLIPPTNHFNLNFH